MHNGPGLQDDSSFISLQSYPRSLDATVVRGYLTFGYLTFTSTLPSASQTEPRCRLR